MTTNTVLLAALALGLMVGCGDAAEPVEIAMKVFNTMCGAAEENAVCYHHTLVDEMPTRVDVCDPKFFDGGQLLDETDDCITITDEVQLDPLDTGQLNKLAIPAGSFDPVTGNGVYYLTALLYF